MSARFPSRWLFAAALLAAEGLTSAAGAQPPELPIDPKVNGVPQVAPAPVFAVPLRLLAEPLLLEVEQVSEHGDLPRTALPTPAPRVLRGCGLPDCGMSPDEVMLRCLLFSINPLSVFIPHQTGVPEAGMTLPSPRYLEHPPQYCPPAPACPPTRELATQQGGTAGQTADPIARAAELIGVMPDEVEEIGVMPDEEESEPPYEFLAPYTDFARFLTPPRWPRTEIKVRVGETQTGSLLYGVGIELSHTGTVAVTTEPLEVAPAPERIPEMPRQDKADRGAQVQLDVLIAEVGRAGTRKLNLGAAASGQPARWVIEVADAARHKALRAGLNGLREKGRAKFLSEPRLMTLSGQRGCFHIGGHQAVPVPDARGEVGVQFEEFGTRVNCLPVVLGDGTIHLEVESELSELCEAAGGNAGGGFPGRSTQRVHTTADVAPGHTLVLGGPKAGGNSWLLLFVTPSVVEPPTATGAAPAEETVHDLLVKCRRELSRGHYAAAEDLAQEAITRDRRQVEADPLVSRFHLLQRVKEKAVLPLGTVEPCGARPEGRCAVSPCEGKAIGSDERVVEVLLHEFNTAFQEGKYREAEALASRVLQIDPDDARAVAALTVARAQSRLRAFAAVRRNDPKGAEAEPFPQAVTALVRFQGDFKEGRYEEARADALHALAVAPGYPPAVAALQLACEALARQPRPESSGQCTYVGTRLRPALPPADPAVVSALQKILIDGEKGGPAGGAEEAEPREDGSKPAPR